MKIIHSLWLLLATLALPGVTADNTTQLVTRYSLVDVMSTAPSTWELHLLLHPGEDWVSLGGVTVKSQPAERAVDLFLPQDGKERNVVGFEKISCEEYKRARGVLSGRCFLISEALDNDLYFPYEVTPEAVKSSRRTKLRESGGETEHKKRSKTESGAPLLEEMVQVQSAGTADKQVGSLLSLEEATEDTDASSFSVKYSLTLHITAADDLGKPLIAGLRLTGVTGSFREVAVRRAKVSRKLDSTTLYARWGAPLVYAASLYILLQGIAWAFAVRYSPRRSAAEEASKKKN
ncbi:hypothetical protein ADEAN_000726700 [Angomonas deanei]|uniref:Transmembrane protein 231 n=1 Tax=Angomonas deanei TaxID=59799 RepID=A0A7G2CIT6_9TRYP|nr:hypothetical protein ADEAN_000726700 [Angomonas deanei]